MRVQVTAIARTPVPDQELNAGWRSWSRTARREQAIHARHDSYRADDAAAA